jgi:predicted GH43/DUF377 family glycosyl hydrolase
MLLIPLLALFSSSFQSEKIKIYSPCPYLEKLAVQEKKDPKVRSAEHLKIPGLKMGYNPSIVRDGDRMLVFFRYDVENIIDGYGIKKKKSYIACAVFDLSLHRFYRLTEIGLDTSTAEDPRAILFEDKIALFFNRQPEGRKGAISSGLRKMAVAILDPKSLEVERQAILDFNSYPIEKNWTPLVSVDESNEKSIFLIHTLTTHILLKMDNRDLGKVEVVYKKSSPEPQMIAWEKRWGSPRGGTPAVQIGEEYWLFFHSHYTPPLKGQTIHNYVMGALVLDAKFPFLPKKIGVNPIVFEGMYGSRYRRPDIFTTYPSGLDYDPDSEILRISVGENDRVMKIVTIEKKVLEATLRAID